MFQRKRKIRVFFIVFIFVNFFFIIHRFFSPNVFFVRSLTSTLLYPVLLVQKTFIRPVANYLEQRKKRKNLETSYSALHKKYQNILAQNIELQASKKYGNDISEMLAFKKKYNPDTATVAQVILKNISQQSHFFLIDKGSRQGIQQDMVVVYKNNLLGKVIQVYPLYSKVLLITDKECKVAAYCSKTKAFGIHVGANQTDTTDLQRISHLLSIKQGDLVVSSGEGLIFPQGFALGHIKTAQKNGLYFDVTVQPLINMQEIDYCVVMEKS
ncbi:rod shape-determining protein MreC [bacterium]|nr:rod shape-determining protein MreC [bacterium]